MPFNSTLVIAVVALFIGIAVYWRTRRVGPVFGVMLAAFVLVAITDQSVLRSGGAAVGDAVSWAIDTVLNL